MDGAERVPGGRTERRRRAAFCPPPVWTVSRTGTGGGGGGTCGAGPGGPGVQVASVGSRRGDALALAEGGGLAAWRRREGPPASPGSPLWLPSCLPAPTASWRRGGRRGVGASATQSFQRHFQRAGRSRCTRGRDGGRTRVIKEAGAASADTAPAPGDGTALPPGGGRDRAPAGPGASRTTGEVGVVMARV